MFFKSLLSILFGFIICFFGLLVLAEGCLSSSLRAGKRPEVDRVLLELVRVLANAKGIESLSDVGHGITLPKQLAGASGPN